MGRIKTNFQTKRRPFTRVPHTESSMSTDGSNTIREAIKYGQQYNMGSNTILEAIQYGKQYNTGSKNIRKA